MKRWAVRIVLVLLMFPFVSYLFGSIDYWRIQKGKRPLFVPHWEGFFDGGSCAGAGFGYELYSYDGVMYSFRNGHSGLRPDWATGPEIEFWWFPFLNKSDVKVVPYEKHPDRPEKA